MGFSRISQELYVLVFSQHRIPNKVATNYNSIEAAILLDVYFGLCKDAPSRVAIYQVNSYSFALRISNPIGSYSNHAQDESRGLG